MITPRFVVILCASQPVAAVDSYCDTPDESCQALRTTVNAKLAPNRVRIECAGAND